MKTTWEEKKSLSKWYYHELLDQMIREKLKQPTSLIAWIKMFFNTRKDFNALTEENHPGQLTPQQMNVVIKLMER